MAEKHQTVIIGGGPAGLTVAIYLRRAGYEVLVLEKEEEGGQIRISEKVVNYPGIEETDGETLMETMRRQAVNFGAQIRRENVISASLTDHGKVIQTEKNHYEAPVVIYAAGSVPRKLNFPGESEFAGRGIAYCATCDGELFTDKPIFVVGGGYAAAEEAMYLTRYSKPVMLIIREPDFTCAKKLADEVKAHPDIKIEYNTEIVRVEGDTSVKKIVFKNALSGKEWTYENTDTIGIFIFAGYLPQTDMVKKQLICDKQGYLLTDEGKRTNVEGVYGAGDVCQKRLRQLVTAVADGAVAAETIAADYPLDQMPALESEHPALRADDPASREENPGDRTNKTGADCRAGGQDALISNVQNQIQGREEKKLYTGEETDRCGDVRNLQKRGQSTAGQMEGAMRPDSQFADIYPQIKEVESRFETVPECRVLLDDSTVSGQVKTFMEDLEEAMPRVHISYEETGADGAARTAGKSSEESRGDDAAREVIVPSIGISSKDGERKGMFFHGTPGGHEFTSFLSALYQAAGPGKPLMDEILTQIASIRMPVRLDVGVTLSCTKCPELVSSAMLVAAHSPQVEVHVVNLAQFPEFKEKHQVFSVPFLMVNGEKTYYGKKSVEELMAIIGESIGKEVVPREG